LTLFTGSYNLGDRDQTRRSQRSCRYRGWPAPCAGANQICLASGKLEYWSLVDLFRCQLLASTRRTSHARRQRAEAKPTDQTSCILTSNRAPFEQHVFPSTESCHDLKFLDADGSRELVDLMGTQSDSATDSGRRGSLSMLM
jgi:hypothetical protein